MSDRLVAQYLTARASKSWAPPASTRRTPVTLAPSTLRNIVAALRSTNPGWLAPAEGRDPVRFDALIRAFEDRGWCARPRALPGGGHSRQAAAIRTRELVQVLRPCMEPGASEDDKTFATAVALASVAGLRVSGYLSLRWGQLSLESAPAFVSLPRSKGDRGARATGAHLPLTPRSPLLDAATLLRALRGRRYGTGTPPPEDKVFVYGADGTTRSRAWFNARLRAAATAAGVPDAHRWTSHGLRAGLATDLWERGTPLEHIRRAGRWRASTTADMYIRPSVATAADLLQPGDRKSVV